MAVRRQQTERRRGRWLLSAALLGVALLFVDPESADGERRIVLRVREVSEVTALIERWVTIAFGDPAARGASGEVSSPARPESPAASAVTPVRAAAPAKPSASPSAASRERIAPPSRATVPASTVTPPARRPGEEELSWQDRRELDDLVERATRD